MGFLPLQQAAAAHIFVRSGVYLGHCGLSGLLESNVSGTTSCYGSGTPALPRPRIGAAAEAVDSILHKLLFSKVLTSRRIQAGAWE